MLWKFRREIIFVLFVLIGMFLIKHNVNFSFSKNYSVEKSIQPSIEELITENKNLKKLMGLKEKVSFSEIIYVSAKSISPWVFPSQIVFDKGTNNGVKPGMTVINNEGYLIGRIFSANENSSLCVTLYHPDTKVSAIIPRTGELAIVEGVSLSSFYPYLKIKFLPPQCKAIEGDIVETSGLTKLFPPSIRIGTILKISSSKTEPFTEGLIKPFFTNENIKTAIIIK